MAEISLSEYTDRQHPTPTKQKRTLPPQTGFFVIGGVLLVGFGFLAGVQYQSHTTKPMAAAQTASSNQNSSYNRASGFGGGFRRGDRAFGTVSAISSSSITVQTRNGATNTYTLTSSTTVNENGQTGSVSDIQTGDTVVLTLDSSNTQDVSTILLNPSFGGGGGNGQSTQDNTTGTSTSNI